METDTLRLRTTITNGDELVLQNACEHFKCKLEIGGPPEPCDGWLNQRMRRVDGSGPKGERTDWMVVYILATAYAQASAACWKFKDDIRQLGGETDDQ